MSSSPAHFPATLERIVLTGFMGSGKTTVGPLVAAGLRWRFVDVDDVIAEPGSTTTVLLAAPEAA